jgi:uncharacterized SAM-binding protein YcdF (DUF218 family)
MSWFTTNLINTFLLPPLVLLLPLGAYILFPRSKIAQKLGIFSFALLWIASTPFFAQGALHLLEGRPLGEQKPLADSAIVILGGGSYFRAPEYDKEDTVDKETLVRLR